MRKAKTTIYIFLCFIIILFMIIPSCSETGSSGGGGGGTDPNLVTTTYTTVISGTVTNQNGGGLLQGVTIIATGNSNIVQETSNPNGTYSITVMHNGTIAIGAALNGYTPYAGTISTTGNSYTQNIQLQSQVAIQNYTTTVSGRVINQNGTGLSNVTILATGSANVVQATTNANGNYTVTVTHNGNIGIGAGLNGYLPYTVIISTTANAYSQNIQLQSQVVIPNCTTTVSGRVINQNGTGLSNVTILATGSANVVQATTNANGNYTVTVTHNGTIVIGANLNGYIPYSTFISTTANTYTVNVILLLL